MKITIQTPDLNAKQNLIDYVREHVEKLALFSDRIVESAVYLKIDKSGSVENKVCEIKLSIPGRDLFAAKQADTFEEAVLLCIDALKSQIERWKGSQSKKVAL